MKISKRAQSIMARCSKRLLARDATVRRAFLKRLAAFSVLCVFSVLSAHGQSYSAMQRTTTLTNTDLIAVETNSAGAAGQRFLRTMTISNFLNNLAAQPGFPVLPDPTKIPIHFGTGSSNIFTNPIVTGRFEATNGPIVLGNAATPEHMTNYNKQWQRSELELNDSGNSIKIRDGAFIDVKSGSAIILGSDGTTNRIFIPAESYITSPTGPSDDNEIYRYRFFGDTSVNSTNRVMRLWEIRTNIAFGVSNYFQTHVSNLQGGTNGLNTRVGNLEGATNGLTTRASNLEGATNGLNTRLTVVSNFFQLTKTNVIFVSPVNGTVAGNDNNDGTTRLTPVATMVTAARKLDYVGEIKVVAGNYTSLKLNLSELPFCDLDITVESPFTNDFGRHVTSFTDNGGGLYSFTTNNDWMFVSSTLTPYLYEMGTPESFIPKAHHELAHQSQNHRSPHFYRLTNAPSLATVANGGWFPSNNTVFLRPIAGGVPGDVMLPNRWPTNSFIHGGNQSHRVRIIGLKIRGSYYGIDYTGISEFIARKCVSEGNYSTGGYSDDNNTGGLIEDCVLSANGNDGWATAQNVGNTNFATTLFRNCAFWLNGDEGMSAHYGSKMYAEDCVIEYHTTPQVGGGIAPFAGSDMTLNRCVIRGNEFGIDPVGPPVVANATWTNRFTAARMFDCDFYDNRIAIVNIALQTNMWTESVRCNFYNSGAICFALANDAANSTNLVRDCTFLAGDLWLEYPGSPGADAGGSWTKPTFVSGNRVLNTDGTYTMLETNVNFRKATVAGALRIQGGQSTSNSFAGGLLMYSTTAFTNHSTVGAFTNFATYTNSAHLLTNGGSAEVGVWRGTFQTGTNQLQVGLGSATNVFDTGAITNLGQKVWEAYAEVTSISPTSQRVDGYIQWDQGGGVPFTRTNFSRFVAQSNGVATRFFLAGQAIGTGRITNDFAKFHYVSSTQ